MILRIDYKIAFWNDFVTNFANEHVGDLVLRIEFGIHLGMILG